MDMQDRYNAAEWLIDRQLADGRVDATAFVCDGAELTYAELQREVFRAQNALRQLGVRRGERVALVVKDEPAFVAWFAGCLRSGVVPVPLSTMLTAADLASVVADCDGGVVVASADFAGHLEHIAAGAPEVRETVVIGEPTEVAGVTVHRWSDFTDRTPVDVAPTRRDTPAFWLYSSGTTGSPKGVMHRQASLEATATTYAAGVLGIRADDRCLSVAKLFFAYGLGNSFTFPLSVGATSILNPAAPTPAGVVELIERESPSLFFATPGFLAALLDTDTDPGVFASVRTTVTAGEALPADLQRRFTERFGHPVLDGIGTTEALHIFISNRRDDICPGTSGRPVDGYEVKLLDDQDSLVTEPDTPGYLHVRGPSTAIGYWSRTEATQAAFRGEWLKTGDVYSRSETGHYRLLGRNSDMIKAGGIWVSPTEVEAVLVGHDDVLEAAVVGARDERDLELVVAFVVPRRGRQISEADLEAYCRERMASFKRPRRVVVLDALPKTPTGKIKRFQLRQEFDHR